MSKKPIISLDDSIDFENISNQSSSYIPSTEEYYSTPVFYKEGKSESQIISLQSASFHNIQSEKDKQFFEDFDSINSFKIESDLKKQECGKFLSENNKEDGVWSSL
jgi:hypothetical protein